MDQFKALMVSKTDDGQTAEWHQIGENDLMEGDVTVKVASSTVNYKDGLAVTGKGPVVRHWPMIPGIDFAGEVVKSTSSEFSEGDQVVLNGWGVGEVHYGGFAEYARVKSDWLIKLPEAFTPAQSMAIGTAGYTAMLCVLALEEQGLTPDKGPVLVTGAAGGVGSVAVSILAKLGYEVLASTGRTSEAEFLKGLGASDIIDRGELSEPGRPMGKERWAGAIDVAGSHTLANVLAQTKYGGVVASTGLAQGPDLKTTVMPFILRAVRMIGVDSVMQPKDKRIEAWGRLASDLDIAKLETLSETHPLEAVTDLAEKILAGQIRGRVIIDVA